MQENSLNLNPKDIAKYIINYYNDRDVKINNLKLQMEMYIIENCFKEKFGENLYDENFKAWKMGPVLETVYYEYSHMGAFSIGRYGYDVELELDSYQKEFFHDLLDEMADAHPFQLARIALTEDGAWHKVFYSKSNHIDRYATHIDMFADEIKKSCMITVKTDIKHL